MKILLVLAILLFLGLPIAAQDSGSDEVYVMPDALMQQVVRRMATFYFKPSRQLRTIYFSEENLKQEWLPQIKNIRFVVIRFKEIEKWEEAHPDTRGYSFIILDGDSKSGTIGFGYGDLGCGGRKGTTWSYKISKQKIKLWPIKHAGFGSACDKF